MCICCILVDTSSRFPFVLLSVRDEMLTRPTSDVKTHPVSTTTCCLDESLPQDKRGTWLAINPKLGTFSLLTNGTEQGRQEPHKNSVPSRGLLVLNSCETRNGRVSEKELAVTESWTTSASTKKSGDDGQEEPPPPPPPAPAQASSKNNFSSPEAVNVLSGFNLLSGSLTPGNIDVRYTTNLYSKKYDWDLLAESRAAPSAQQQSDDDNRKTGVWALSNTFLDNVHEPRLEFLCRKTREAVAAFEEEKKNKKKTADNSDEKKQQDDDDSDAKELANILGDVLLSRPNFTDSDLPIEHLNLSEADKKDPREVEVERECQRNIASFCQWWDGPPPSFEQPQQQQQDDKKSSGHDHEHEHEHGLNNAKFHVSPGLTPATTSKKLEWGTRNHTVVFVEQKKNKKENDKEDEEHKGAFRIHDFVRNVDINIDHSSPAHGVSHQPEHTFVPKPWTHFAWNR